MHLHFDQVTLAFGSRILLHQFSFVCTGPGILILCGESGSGKTSWLRLLQGLKPTAGTVYVNGLAMHTLTDTQQVLVRQHILSVVHQQPRLFLDATVKAMIEQIMRLKLVKQFPHAWFHTFLKDVQPHQFIRTLSRGQLQRLAVLLATLGPARILLLDEPLDGLDAHNRRLMIHLLMQLSSTYRCIIATHHQEEFDTTLMRLYFPNPRSQTVINPPTLRRSSTQPKIMSAFSLSFLMNYHRRAHRKNHGGLSIPLPTLMLLLMSLIFATAEVMNGYLQSWTRTMLGGDFQWFEPIEPSSFHLEVPSPYDMEQLIDKWKGIHEEKDFDMRYFETYFPTTSGYLIHQGFKSYFPGFSMETFNDYQMLNEAPIGFHQRELFEEEIILGLEPSHLALLASSWGTFPTIVELDRFVQVHRPLVYFDFEYEPWGYSSQIAFEIVGVFAYSTLTVFHSSQNYSEHIFSSMLRFPLSPFHLPHDAWFIPYTYRIRVEEIASFLYTYHDDPFFQQWELQRKDKWNFRVFKHNRVFSLQRPPDDRFKYDTLHHSSLGYQFLPNQWMQGFPLPILWMKESFMETDFMEAYMDLRIEEWLSLQPPPHVARSHLYLGAQASVTLALLPASAQWNDVAISSTFAKTLHVIEGDVLLANVFYLQRIHPISLRVTQIQESSTLYISLPASRWEMLLIEQATVGSWDLQPSGYAYFGDNDGILPKWDQSRPYQSIKTTFQTVSKIAYVVLGILFFLLLIPSFLVFVQTIQLALLSEMRVLHTMASYGFSPHDLFGFVHTKLLYQGGLILCSFLLGFFPFELALQHLWAQSLEFSWSYTFPWTSLLFMGSLGLLFYLVIKNYLKNDVLTQIKKLW